MRHRDAPRGFHLFLKLSQLFPLQAGAVSGLRGPCLWPPLHSVHSRSAVKIDPRERVLQVILGHVLIQGLFSRLETLHLLLCLPLTQGPEHPPAKKALVSQTLRLQDQQASPALGQPPAPTWEDILASPSCPLPPPACCPRPRAEQDPRHRKGEGHTAAALVGRDLLFSRLG